MWNAGILSYSPPHASAHAPPYPPTQILAVALLNGKMHYCANEENREYIDPYYVLPEGETIFKDW